MAVMAMKINVHLTNKARPSKSFENLKYAYKDMDSAISNRYSIVIVLFHLSTSSHRVFKRRNPKMIKKQKAYKTNLSVNALGAIKITETNQTIAQYLLTPILRRE
jgi:hypothetical protein